jgi:uncharacterized protein YkwD
VAELDTHLSVDVALPEKVEPPPEPDRRRKRRLIWPLLLTSALVAASWTIAQAATLPPLPFADAAADRLVTDAAQAPIAAVVPTAGPLASAKTAPFGPQIEVILPPPPPPPPPAASGGGSGSTGRKKTVTANMSYTAFCAGGASATASPGSVADLLTAVNAERARIGSTPLTWNSTLAGQAQGWSTQMASDQAAHSEFDLNTQPGRDLISAQIGDPNSVWRKQVFRHSGAFGENIAFAYGRGTNPAGVHVGWMGSEGHCKNIMNPSYTQFGAGDASSSDAGYFATERFS